MHKLKRMIPAPLTWSGIDGVSRRLASGLAALTLVSASFAVAAAPQAEHHHHGSVQAVPAPFVATTAKPFAQLMDDSMAVMNYGMTAAPMTGNPDHDFAAMMIPHHQGAVDMAKIEMLYGKDPVLRRLAQEIIITQGSEIAVMQKQLRTSSGSNPAQR